MNGDDRSTVDDWVHLPPTELVASVAVAPAPEIPLASLRPMLTAVRDDDGQLVDWTIDLTEVFDIDPTAATISEYRAWRRTWRHDWPIGPITNVASLLDESSTIDYDTDRHLDGLLASIVAADGTEVSVDATAVPGLMADLETVRLALAVDDRAGTGLVDDMPTGSRSSGLARTWAPARTEVVLAATPRTSVLIRPDEGLVLVHGEPESATTFTGVAAVDMRADTVLVLNERGSSMRLSQTDARPLGWIVPRSLRWHLRQVPLVAVWALLFDGLTHASAVADERGVPVRIDSQSSTGHAQPPTDFLDL
jgi:hypothetical protein